MDFEHDLIFSPSFMGIFHCRKLFALITVHIWISQIYTVHKWMGFCGYLKHWQVNKTLCLYTSSHKIKNISSKIPNNELNTSSWRNMIIYVHSIWTMASGKEKKNNLHNSSKNTFMYKIQNHYYLSFSLILITVLASCEVLLFRRISRCPIRDMSVWRGCHVKPDHEPFC